MKLVRSHNSDPDFLTLVDLLDAALRITDGPDHAFYNQFNGSDTLDVVGLLLADNVAISCGAYRIKNDSQVEIKRMYTRLSYRKRGCARLILTALENWATEDGFSETILETGINQDEALAFYPKMGYQRIPNFEPYIGVKTSICFGKKL